MEKLQGCFDELKQKLQTVNITSDDIVVTTSNPILHQQKEISHEKKEMLNSNTSDVVDNSDVTSKSSKENPSVSQRMRSLPRIYNATINPSLDDEDGEIWRYIYTANKYY